jgi:hypothetical protein
MQDWFNHNFDKLLMSAVFGALMFIYLRTHDTSIQQLLGQAFTAITALVGVSRLVRPSNGSNGNGATATPPPAAPPAGAAGNFR